MQMLQLASAPTSRASEAVVASAGGVDAVVAAMRAHGGSASVQEEGCAALRNLALGDALRASIASAGGIEAFQAYKAVMNTAGSAASNAAPDLPMKRKSKEWSQPAVSYRRTMMAAVVRSATPP